MTAKLIFSGGTHRVLVRDLSRHGATIYADAIISSGDDVCFSRGAIFVAARVIWRRNGGAGLEFYRPLRPCEMDEPSYLPVEAEGVE